MPARDADAAAGAGTRRLFIYNGGFLTQKRLRRILSLSGYRLRIGKPAAAGHDRVGVWGRSPTSPRGDKVADVTGAAVLRVEDAFLRSIRMGRDGAPPLGLILDELGVHFDSAAPSRLEHLAATHPLDDSALLARARDGMERLQAMHLSKYNDFDEAAPAPDAPYVLVIDQTRDDASITYGAASATTFREMLVFAQTEHPGARIVIKSHPETLAGHRPGHYSEADTNDRISLCTATISPWRMLEHALAVYTVSSQMGYEAILAGHKPRVFGQPFYAGWGLTQDENPVARRTRRLTRAQLFAVSHILAPTWYDPCRDRLCSFEDAVDQLEAEVHAFRQDRRGYVATGMRLWKRGHLLRAFGREKPLFFEADPGRAFAEAQSTGRDQLLWGAAPGRPAATITGPETPRLVRVEDGLLRSRGLGAALVPPLSLITDDQGIYYDPARESRLEQLIAAGPPPGGEMRAEKLIAQILRAGLSKYNLGQPAPDLSDLPAGHRILVPGQVEDDASILKGAGEIRTNLALLERTRADNPKAVILYKPHPDVEAGLRAGAIPEAQALQYANRILTATDPAQLLAQVHEVWTMTSALGFEALLRGLPVTTLGAPFYAGWGLTRDLAPVPIRRQARPTLAALAHAVLIAYPRYMDPTSGLPCPPEVIVERLQSGALPRSKRWLRVLAKLQGALATYAHLWR